MTFSQCSTYEKQHTHRSQKQIPNFPFFKNVSLKADTTGGQFARFKKEKTKKDVSNFPCYVLKM